MTNIDKRKLNKHLRIIDELYSECRKMERSLAANGMGMASHVYGETCTDLYTIEVRLKRLKEL